MCRSYYTLLPHPLVCPPIVLVDSLIYFLAFLYSRSHSHFYSDNLNPFSPLWATLYLDTRVHSFIDIETQSRKSLLLACGWVLWRSCPVCHGSHVGLVSAIVKTNLAGGVTTYTGTGDLPDNAFQEPQL